MIKGHRCRKKKSRFFFQTLGKVRISTKYHKTTDDVSIPATIKTSQAAVSFVVVIVEILTSP